MMNKALAESRFRELVGAWRHWSQSASRTEDGWPSDFPRWPDLIDAASDVMSAPVHDAVTLEELAEIWEATEEDEELLDRAKVHVSEWWPTLEQLAHSSRPACRWQAYEAASAVGRRAEGVLRAGLADPDPYARRRAILALARLRPDDARALADAYLADADPYVRQAAIELVVAVDDVEYRAAALRTLAQDAVEHVRRAAHERLTTTV